MKKSLFLVSFFLLLFISCDKKSKVEKAVEEIPVQIRVVRFDKAFFEAKPSDLQNLKAEYPFFFPEGNDDRVWLDKMQNPLWRELYDETEKKYSNFGKQTTEIEELFKHLKYYFPTIITPTVYTVIGEMDYNNKAIYANDKLIIALELYLGKEHKFYEFPAYLKQNFEERQMMPDIVSSFAMRTNPPSQDKSLLAEMIYYGKELYLKDLLLPDYTDAEKIGYLPEQITWCQENESYMWRFFIDENILYSSDSRLPNRFINLAPFSKFYLEIDNESPGRVGQWIGWQIVRSFMKNNEKVTVQDLLKMDYKEIFDRSKYKPKKNE
ncbi:gliding motility lipoprotein GldB [Flavobacterium capsici]|uniref:Gliding motility lipoprotein GldB n=1 Tax=Flavobacterium capsici TaxID=3075618 RepID=A0AA96EXU1_9FLAO|nr:MULTISPECIES: gliding motility lipoprotein GldB [unclassified Flavobacterium]WNM19194.1 gliding motility lipoprotein GldB [Flavobacterium sp. PMR2A8]WNM20583.1 gliding motility lipoprotein GldB [Flavobacterium sp. PMTSA4]